MYVENKMDSVQDIERFLLLPGFSQRPTFTASYGSRGFNSDWATIRLIKGSLKN